MSNISDICFATLDYTDKRIGKPRLNKNHDTNTLDSSREGVLLKVNISDAENDTNNAKQH